MQRAGGCNITQSQAFTVDPTVSGLSQAHRTAPIIVVTETISFLPLY